jgi:hypothetical protein
MKNILIATPSYDGKLDVWYTHALLQTVLLGDSNNIKFTPIFLSYDALIQRSRNDLIKIAIENNFDGVLWIDSDIEWEPEWAVAVVNSNKEVLGLPVIKKGLEEAYNVKSNIKNLVLNNEGFISVLSIGTGFLYMSNKAISYLWQNSQEYATSTSPSRMVFEVQVQDGELISEDFSVCNKLRKGGFEILIDPSKTCNHIGILKFTGNFAEFISKLTTS